MIYIMCPANSYTGGPTLAHQLCYVLNKNDIPATMWYIFFNPVKRYIANPVHDRYKHFHNPYTVKTPADVASNTIVALESKIPVLRNFKNAKRAVWWMSVDNFYLNMGNIIELVKRKFFKFKPTLEYCMKFKNKPKYLIYKKPDVIHYVQSEYARLFLLNEGVKQERIMNLSDYIEDEVVEARRYMDCYKRENSILYNPKKGFEFTQEIIKANPQYKWIPLINMSKKEVTEALLKSKLYIDFGTHPGKDRFPREAVLCGCCLITGRRGAAANDVDIPISPNYKIEDCLENIPQISRTIEDVMENYQDRVNDFNDFCLRTLNEQKTFEEDAVRAFKGN